MPKEDLYNRFIDHTEHVFPSMLHSGKTYLLAFSGGVDSTVLGSILSRAGVHFATAHCNFHLRAKEADRDALFAAQMAEKWDVKHHRADFDTEGYARQNGISIEMAARNLRYAWFEDLLLSNSYSGILTAHHGDDQIETILLNFTRGTSLEGLLGMRPVKCHVMRPLLPFSREEIIEYAAQNNIPWVEDSTNISSDYTRNYLRHKVIPQLKQVNSSLVKSVYRNTDYLREVESFYREAMDEKTSSLIEKSAENDRISIEKVQCLKEHAGIVMYELLRKYGLEDKVDDVIQSLDSQSGKMFISPTYRLLRDRDFLIAEPISQLKTPQEYATISKDTTEIFSPLHLIFSEEKNECFEVEKDVNTAYFDTEKVVFPLKLRQWKEGDFFHPYGMKGVKKVSKYLKDSKISLFEKEKTYVLTDAKDVILWLVGLRRADECKVSEKTQKILKIKNIRK